MDFVIVVFGLVALLLIIALSWGFLAAVKWGMLAAVGWSPFQASGTEILLGALLVVLFVLAAHTKVN